MNLLFRLLLVLAALASEAGTRTILPRGGEQ